MIKYRKNCDVCSYIKEKPRIAEEIYKTTAYDKTSGVSLATLQKIYKSKFSYTSLLNHVKKHQGISQEDLADRNLRSIVTKAEKQLLKQNLEAKDIWQEVLDIGHQELKDGNIKVKVNDMLRAAKDKSDYDLKVKDQELAMIGMVWHFASGENNKPIKGKIIDAEPVRRDAEEEAGTNLHTTPELAEDTGAGENGSSSVYYPPTWDAATFGTSQIPAGDNTA